MCRRRRATRSRPDRRPSSMRSPLVGIDPDLLRIVAARRALEAGERRAAVDRLVARRVDRVDDVGILRIDVDAAVVAALPVSNPRSSAAIWRQVAPPSSERYSPQLPMRNTRCALVFIATATDVRPSRRGSPPPVISCPRQRPRPSTCTAASLRRPASAAPPRRRAARAAGGGGGV